jgi:alkylated DNA repair protein alkB family protein 8
VLHFGHKFNYHENNALVPTEEPIPPMLDGLIDKIMQQFPAHAHQHRSDQITVNIYEPGQGIAPHTDTHSAFAEPIYSLSLCSDVVMEFRDIATTGKHCDVLLARRSLLEMTNEARYRFKHGYFSWLFDAIPKEEIF